MPILELCAGYGGLGMAVEKLTGDKVAYVAEVDEAATKILTYRYPSAPNIGDITSYDWSQLKGLVDVITAGFPCQDISLAGNRKGISGERSGIWKNVCEAVGILRPRFVFLENVAAIRGRGLNVVSEDLADVGYDLLWTTLRASEVGPPPSASQMVWPRGPRNFRRPGRRTDRTAVPIRGTRRGSTMLFRGWSSTACPTYF